MQDPKQKNINPISQSGRKLSEIEPDTPAVRGEWIAPNSIRLDHIVDATQTPSANKIVVADANGHIDGWINIAPNADKLDGYDTTLTGEAGKIPVLDSSGKVVDSDKTDGYHASQTPTANTIPVSDSSGFIAEGYIAPHTSRAQAYHSTAQSVPNQTYTNIIYQTETLDTLGEYDPTTGRFTAQRNGVYFFVASLVYASATWAAGSFGVLAIKVNGTAEYQMDRVHFPASWTNYVFLSGAKIVGMNAGNYANVVVYQTSGAAINTYPGITWNLFTVVRLA